MDDQKKGYTFTDKRGRAEEPEKIRESRDPLAGKEDPSSSGPQEEFEVDFSTLIMSFASAAMISMGRIPDPATGQVGNDPVLARQNIHIIAMLQEKTRGNLSGDEERLMENILYELRMSFIESQRG